MRFGHSDAGLSLHQPFAQPTVAFAEDSRNMTFANDHKRGMDFLKGFRTDSPDFVEVEVEMQNNTGMWVRRHMKWGRQVAIAFFGAGVKDDSKRWVTERGMTFSMRA